MNMFRFIRSPIGIAAGVSAVLITSLKTRAAFRKAAVKTIAAFIGKKEKAREATTGMKGQLPKARAFVRKVAVKLTVPILGIVGVVQDSITQLQKKWGSDVLVPISDEEINYEGSFSSSHHQIKT